MTVTLSSSDRQRKAGTYQFAKSYTQSTATAPQAMDITADIHILGMGTATGAPVRNLYTLAAGIEGQEVDILSDATGNAGVIFTQVSGRLPLDVSVIVTGGAATSVDAAWASATGQYVFSASNQYVRARFMNSAWFVNECRGVTLATTT
jgi:hypothetical protein